LLGQFGQEKKKSIGNFRTINQPINQSNKINHRYTDSLTGRAVGENTQNEENSPSKAERRERKKETGRRKKGGGRKDTEC